jgi:hypothetical protein
MIFILPFESLERKISGYDKDDETMKAWVRRMLLRPKTEKRTQWFGYLSDGRKSKYLSKLEYKLEKKSIRRKNRTRKVCLKDGTDIEWEHIPEELDIVEKYSPNLSILTYGVPKEGVSFWKV